MEGHLNKILRARHSGSLMGSFGLGEAVSIAPPMGTKAMVDKALGLNHYRRNRWLITRMGSRQLKKLLLEAFNELDKVERADACSKPILPASLAR